MSEQVHTGQLLKKAVSDSGIKIAELARKIGRSRRFIYFMFDKQDVSLHYILQIGDAINHDFFAEIKSDHNNIPHLYQKEGYWKDKYLRLLEEHNELLKLHYGKH
jgi:hypothetical protein